MVFHKLRHRYQLPLIFFGVALIMGAYETLKELYFRGSETLWESHLMTVLLTSTIATVASVFMRRWALRVNEQLRIAAVAFEGQNGMIVTDARQVILRVNRTLTEITGYTESEVVGQQMSKILNSGRDDAAINAEMRDRLQRTGLWQGELLNRRKNGETYPGELTITAVKENRSITHYVGALNDVTLRKVAEEKIRNLAFYDALTKLPNRSLLSDRMNQAMVASERSDHYCAALVLDLDNFKSLNDTQGHDVGDLLLAEAARRISSCVRELDTAARLGGDEFVVVLRELAVSKAEARNEASIIAEKIRASLAQPYFLTAQHKEGNAKNIIEHHCTSSIGIAIFINHEASYRDILKWADMAMYKAKEDGGNTIRFHNGQIP